MRAGAGGGQWAGAVIHGAPYPQRIQHPPQAAAQTMQQPRDFQDADLASAMTMASDIEDQTLAAQEEALYAEERDLAAAEEAFRVSNPEQDAAMNPSDHGRLAELSSWLESEELEDAFDMLITNGFRSLKVRPTV